MTNEEQDTVCKAIAASCMWGQSGIASVILEELDERVPMDRAWDEAYASVAKQAQHETVGIEANENALLWYLSHGYWLTNFDDGGCSLFNPPPMNGLCKYVSKELADKYRSRYDYTTIRTYPSDGGILTAMARNLQS